MSKHHDTQIFCPNCGGSGLESIWRNTQMRECSCLACNGTGRFEDFAYRLLSGEICRDDVLKPWGMVTYKEP